MPYGLICNRMDFINTYKKSCFFCLCELAQNNSLQGIPELWLSYLKKKLYTTREETFSCDLLLPFRSQLIYRNANCYFGREHPAFSSRTLRHWYRMDLSIQHHFSLLWGELREYLIFASSSRTKG